MDQNVETEIVEFLTSKGYPQTFGEINDGIKEQGIKYKNSDKDRSGLAHTLNRLIKQNKIKKHPKDDNNKYPTYVTLEQTTFDAAFDGYLTRVEATAFLYRPLPHMQMSKDIDKMFKRKKPLDFNECSIQKLIAMLGLQIIYSVIIGYERPNNRDKKGKIIKSNLDAWMKNALAFHDPLEQIGELVAEHLPDLTTDKLKKILKSMYPVIAGRLEDSRDGFDELRNDLRGSYLRRKDFAARMREQLPISS